MNKDTKILKSSLISPWKKARFTGKKETTPHNRPYLSKSYYVYYFQSFFLSINQYNMFYGATVRSGERSKNYRTHTLHHCQPSVIWYQRTWKNFWKSIALHVQWVWYSMPKVLILMVMINTSQPLPLSREGEREWEKECLGALFVLTDLCNSPLLI